MRVLSKKPLVSQELWDTVHQMMKARRRENGSHEVQPFAGLVKCADCGSSLNVSYDGKRGRYTGFSCWVYKNYGKQRCTSHAIGWKTLTATISASEQVYEDVEAFLPLVRQYTDLQELNAHILNELIEKIVVHEKERDEDGNVTQQVDIYYRFIGYIDPAAVLGEATSPAKSSGEATPAAIIL